MDFPTQDRFSFFRVNFYLVFEKFDFYLHYIIYFTEYFFGSFQRFLWTMSIGATGQD